MIRFASTCALALLLAILLIPDATLGQSLIRDDDPKQPGIEPGQTMSEGQRVRYVRLDPTALAESTVILRLFDDANYRAQRKGGRRHQQTDVWVGEIENEPMSSVIVSLHESGVLFGKIEVGSRSFFIKHFSGPVYAVIERDPDLPEENEAVGDDFIILGDEAIQGDDDFGPEGDQDLQLGKLDADSACLPTTSCGPQVIDIMVVYTAAARSALGGTDPLAEAAITTAVAEMNTGLSNAGVSHSFNLVFTGEVSYAESGDGSTDLSRLGNTSDGFLDVVHDMRNTYGADIVSLITDTGGCGIGYVPSTPTNLTSTSGFSVVRDDCLTGNKTLAHEVGHNMGLHHDWYVNNATTPCEWHHGYVNQAAFGGTSNQRWRTIMAYNNQCAAGGFNCTRLTYYSNPNNTFTSNPMGVAQGNSNPADNAFGLERTACQIANHRPSVVAQGPVAAFTADVTSGDPPLMVNFTDQSTNSPTSWSWDFGDGGSSTSQHPSHSYSGPGIYTVTLTASNASGSDDEIKTGYIAVFGLVTDAFQQGLNGYAGARDTKIKSDFPTTNYGTDPSLEVDGSPDYAAILHWDISSIPPGAVVTGVDVTLNVTDPTTDSYEFYEMKRAWVESQATFQVYASGQSWQTAGANGANDRGSTVLGSVAASTGSQTFPLNASGEALVQGWIDNPASNNGLILLDYGTPTNGVDFTSKETPTVANRPKLSVSYSTGGNIPPAAAFVGMPSVGNAPLNVSFDASQSGDVDGSIVAYSWDFGDGGMGSGVSTSHDYSAGEYEARLIVTDDGGVSDTTYQQIHAVAPGPISFAVLGDFGDAGPEEADVAAEVISWNPDFIITAGDNNYPNGESATIDANIGQYYSDYIYPYTGSYGSTATTNRFFPSLGNHDWNSMSCSGGSCSGAHFDYFDLPPGPGDERYYDFVWGDVHFFAVDSDTKEPDGTTAGSTQGVWLQNALAASTAQWKVVYFHHAPYSSSSNHGSTTGMQWPFATWGADAVIAGHDHTYERIFQDGIVYFVNGLGGRSIYALGTPIAGSQVQYNADYGAQLVTANADSINFRFITRQGTLIDSYTLSKPGAAFTANVTSGTAPLTVDFTDESTGSPTSWSWDFGDTGSSTAQNPSHEYTTPGNYTVSLTATNTHGSDVETKIAYISVAAPTPPVADFTADTTSGKVPLTVDFTDLSTNTPTSWSWSFGDTGTSTEQNPSYQYTAPGNYTVSLTATNADGSDGETKVDYISVLALTPPVAEFTADTTSGKVPLTVDFTDLSTNTPTSWSWSFGDTGTSIEQSPSHQYTAPGNYTVTLTATNDDGSDGETKVDYISVLALTPPVAEFTADTTSGKVPLTVDFTDLSTNTPTSWSWSFGDTGTSTEQNPSHEYTAPGNYTVTLTATNDDGSDDETKVDYITVESPFVLYYAQSETTPSGTQSGDYLATHADDGTLEILTEAQTGGNPSSRTSLLDHRWTFDVSPALSLLFRASAYRDDNPDGDDFDFAYSTDNVTFSPLFTVDTSVESDYQVPVPTSLNGTVYVRVMDTNRGRGASSQDKVYVDHMYFEALTSGIAPVAEFSASPTAGGAPLIVQFTDLSSYAPTSWDWDFGDGESSTDQHPNHTYVSPGTFDVSLTVTNADGSDVEEKLEYVAVSDWPAVHVSDLVVSRTGNNWVRGTAAVTISDAGGTPVGNVTVEGVFSAPNPASFNDMTDVSGVAMFQSDRTKTPPANWCFEVTNVSKDGTVYDPGANVSTARCEDGSSPDAALATLAEDQMILGGLDNHPNPFNPSTVVSFRVDRERRVRVEVFDPIGRRVAVLADEVFRPGGHTVRWDAAGQATGAYIYRLISEDYVATRVMLLLK